MNGDDFVPLLGLTVDDARIQAFLANCGITEQPKLESDDDETAIVENAKLGLEVTFKDERFLDVKSAEYEEGDLVLSNVRMYGTGDDMFREFPGRLPCGLRFESTPQDAEAALQAKPAWVNSDSTHARWDFATHCLFLRFRKAKELAQVSVQLPRR